MHTPDTLKALQCAAFGKDYIHLEAITDLKIKFISDLLILPVHMSTENNEPRYGVRWHL